MKRITIILIASVLLINLAQAQQKRKVVSNDSILRMFRTMNPFVVLKKLDFSKIDYKVLYGDTVLKPYLMKWLDRDLYTQYTIDERRSTITNSPELIKNEIWYDLLKQGRKNALDSILKDSVLYARCRKNAIETYVNNYINNLGNRKVMVPNEAIFFHSYLAYPESYCIIKQTWEEQGKNPHYLHRYFWGLLQMMDPETLKSFDDTIQQLVQTNGQRPILEDIYSDLFDIHNSYMIAKFLELIKIDKKILVSSDDEVGTPFGYEALHYLINEISDNAVAIDMEIKRTDPSKLNKKQINKIKAATQKLIEKYKAEEYYWMKNMPFYK